MKKILIIDDEIHIVELLKFNLENNGYKVDYSYDGFDGYLKTKEFQPDLILLDWMLPNISGDIIEKLTSLQSGTMVAFGTAFKIPVIVKMDMPDPAPYSSNCDVVFRWKPIQKQ